MHGLLELLTQTSKNPFSIPPMQVCLASLAARAKLKRVRKPTKKDIASKKKGKEATAKIIQDSTPALPIVPALLSQDPNSPTSHLLQKCKGKVLEVGTSKKQSRGEREAQREPDMVDLAVKEEKVVVNLLVIQYVQGLQWVMVNQNCIFHLKKAHKRLQNAEGDLKSTKDALVAEVKRHEYNDAQQRMAVAVQELNKLKKVALTQEIDFNKEENGNQPMEDEAKGGGEGGDPIASNKLREEARTSKARDGE
ncbi:hypothetical protein Acr_00g0082630 [Actinidia rufa]|uniref:Uncharacterized protein n=1 Tax=Actinidia rufa TaxID=165716 RepID=A0A7J0DUY6_9ERIC|nr:hypothetical protein Acr_00g0082630 [Actinidia rufa]